MTDLQMKNAQEIMEVCVALVDLDVPGHAIVPILRWLADLMEQPTQVGVREDE